MPVNSCARKDATMATANINSMNTSKGTNSGSKQFHGRLKVDAQFCPADIEDLFSTVDWDVRSAQIKGENGELIFEQTNCEVPSFWSQLATNVICSKYFYGEVGTPEREYSVRQLVHRVARTITDWGLEDGYFATPADGERFYRELAWLCLHQHGAFNSPVWFNVGLYHQYGVSGSKCNWRWDPQAREVVRPSISSATETLAVQIATRNARTIIVINDESLYIFTSSPNVLYGMMM